MSDVLESEAAPGTVKSITEPWWRRGIGYIALAALAYVPPLLTAPGRVAADTKQYLYLDPGELMSRAVTMWDPNVGMGTVTHQTIGYLFPMGPFYWVLDAVGLPDWVAQRLWLGSLVFFAGLGVLYLLRSFAIRGPGVVIAALAYMFTPYALDYAARISVLLLPWAALPWLLGVMRKALRRGGWRYPAIFALIIQVIGGVNATALLFVGVAPALWVVHAWWVAREVPLRRAFEVTWRTGLLTVLTSLWWISGLRMQAAYGLDILRYTETIDAVARTSTPNEVLRGLGYWFFYGQDRLGPWIEAAANYTQRPSVILAGYGLAALGLLGAGLVRWRHRVFFVAMLLVGVVIAVGAHPYESPTPLGALFKWAALNSSAGLALRSTGRAAPLVVLSLAVLLGLLVNVLVARLRARSRSYLGVGVVAIVGAMLLVNFPAIHDGTYYGENLQRPEDIPGYWTDAIAALDARGRDTRILEVPGSDFSSYRWGNTVDPITPGLTDRPYLARELIPYGTAGTADLLNAIDRRLQEGSLDPRSVAPLLRRMGIGDVVARNDIQWERYDLIPPRELSRLLDNTPGIGPPVGFGARGDWSTPGFEDEVALGAPPGDRPLAPVEVYPVQDPVPIIHGEAGRPTMMSGDGEGLVDAAAVGLLDGTGALRYAASYTSAAALRDAVGAGDILVVTDNNRLRARKWSSVKDNLGYTELPGEADAPLVRDNGDARLPLFPGEREAAYTTVSDVGIRRIRISAYGNTITYTPEDRGMKAFDGDEFTAWRTSAFGDARGQRIRVELDRPITTDRVNLVQPRAGPRKRWITDTVIRFDGGDAFPVTLGDASRTDAGQTVEFGQRTFSTFEIEVAQTNDPKTNLFGRDDSVGFAEIRLRDAGSDRDIGVREVVQMPTDLVDAMGTGSADHPLVFVMHRDALKPVPPRSQPEVNIDRSFTVPTRRTFVLQGSGEVSLEASPAAINAALGIPDASAGGVSMWSSPVLSACRECVAPAAIDGNPATAWQTIFDDGGEQYLDYTLAAPITFDSMNVRVVNDGRHSVPTALRLEVDGQVREVTLRDTGDQATEMGSVEQRVTFPAVSGTHIKVSVAAKRERYAQRYATSYESLMPVAIAELGIPGLTLPSAPAVLDSGCRNDLVTVDGAPFPVRVSGPAAASTAVMGLTVTSCDPGDPALRPVLTLGPGPHQLTTAVGKNTGWSIDRLVLASGTDAVPVTMDGGRITRIGTGAPPSEPRVEVISRGRTGMRVRVSGADTPFWMVLGQSRSPGWHARIPGQGDLGPSQLVDGYANGWRVTPTGDTFEVEFTWAPQRQVWAAIWISAIAAAACLAIIALSRRRTALYGAAIARPGDADLGIEFVDTTDTQTDPDGFPVRGESRRVPSWIAPAVAGTVAALAVAPWAGVVIAGLVALLEWKPQSRRYVMLAPAALLLACGAFIAAQQRRYQFPPVFEWPTLFPRVRTWAWLAVMVLMGDAVLTVVRRRASGPGEPDAGESDSGGSRVGTADTTDTTDDGSPTAEMGD